MIAYGCAVGDEERFRRCALPAIERVRGTDVAPFLVRGSASIFSAYNEILVRARREPDAEALVLLHEDTDIRDPRFEEKVREALEDERVAIVGAVGAVGVTGIDWWVHERLVGAARFRSVEPFPHPALPLIADGTVVGPGGGGEVDTVDGFLLVLSRWAIDELRFDEDLGPGFHGYDADLCFQARERGRRVVVADLSVDHHQRELLSSSHREAWKRAHIAFRRKWEGRSVAGVEQTA